jgi:uncharacterized domain HDIG
MGKTNYKIDEVSIIKVLNGTKAGLPLDSEVLIGLGDTIFENWNECCYVMGWLSELKNTDLYTYNHSINVGLYSMLLAYWLGIPYEEIYQSTQAGLLHDIGKVKVDIDVLNKKEKLTKEEFEEIKLHTVHGFNIIKDTDCISYEVKKTILMHHEREDGSGYPIKSKSHMINMYTKIVAVTDVYDAMTSDRVYKRRVSPNKAIEMFTTTGINLFDVNIVNTFIKNILENNL